MTCRLLLVAYAGLAGLLPAAGRPWAAVPLCLAVLLATGGLWMRALPGVPTETGLPAIRAGLTAAAGLMTLPLVALLLHAAGQPVRPIPLVAGCAAVVTVLGAGGLLRERLAGRRVACLPGLPAQRRHPGTTSPGGPAPSAGPTTSPAPPSPASAAGPAASPPAAAGLDASPPAAAGLDASPPAAAGLDASPAASAASPAASAASPAAAASPVNSSVGSVGSAGGSLAAFDREAVRASGGPASGGAVVPGPRRAYARTTAAVTIPVVLAVGVGGTAVRGYLTAPRPAEPGYLSVALGGWAAAIDSPVTVPARGLAVPVRVSSAGLGETTHALRLRVGGQVVTTRPMTVAADSVHSLTVHVPALPADGCLRAVDISVGSTSTGFYARGLPRAGVGAGAGAGAGRPAVRAGSGAAGPAVLAGSGAGKSTVPGGAGSRAGVRRSAGQTAC